MESNILKYSIKIIRVFLYTLIVLLSIILLYSRFHTREMDFAFRDFLNSCSDVTKWVPTLKE